MIVEVHHHPVRKDHVLDIGCFPLEEIGCVRSYLTVSYLGHFIVESALGINEVDACDDGTSVAELARLKTCAAADI